MKNFFTKYSRNITRIITVEDGTVSGGFGSAVLEFMAAHNYSAKLKILGIPDRIVEHGTPKELHKRMWLRCEGHRRNGIRK